MSLLDATNASFEMGFIVFNCCHAGTRHHNTVLWCNISISRLRYSANHNALDSWPIRARKNRHISERRGIEEQQ